jgi:hypothetical protein
VAEALPAVPTYDREHLPGGPYYLYKKKVPIIAHRMDGPFQVLTSEGPLTCQDGWLCMDARGYPYPVAADEFTLIYSRS